MDALTPRIKRFCEEYIKDFNGTQAAIRAGYSKKTANEQSSQLLAKLNVQDFLSKLKQNLSDKNEGLAQQVIDELKKIGFSNIQDYIKSDNEIKDLTTITRDKAPRQPLSEYLIIIRIDVCQHFQEGNPFWADLWIIPISGMSRRVRIIECFPRWQL